MGIIIAKFRKEKTTTEQLERLEEKIQEIEKYTINTQEQKKRFVGNFLAISIGVYVIAFIVFYFVYFPPTWKERIIYSVPLFLFPIVIIFLRKLFTWYFQRKLNKNSQRLTKLRVEKKKILEQVMDKETYKVAVNLLARFGDKSYSNNRPALAMTPRPTTTNTQSNAGQSNLRLNQSFRSLNTSTAVANRNTALTPRAAPAATTATRLSNSPNYMPRQLQMGQQTQLAPQVQTTQELRRRTPFPVLDFQNKGVLDKIVDVLMGDGPQDRFAMICKECFAHNGMALKDDFDFMSYRCAFCNAMNPARKARQVAPLLPKPDDGTPSHLSTRRRNSSDSTSTSSSSSDDESPQNDAMQRMQLNFDETEDVAATRDTTEEMANLIDEMEVDEEITEQLNENAEKVNANSSEISDTKESVPVKQQNGEEQQEEEQVEDLPKEKSLE